MNSRSRTRARAVDASAAQLERLVRRSLVQGSRALYRDAELFDQFYRRRSADVRFYVDIARRYGGPVLELGVGTGRIAFAIAGAGFEVVGIDAMAEMLARARRRGAKLPAAVRARVSFRKGDMRRLSLRRRFALVLAPFNAFTHLYDRRELERALEVCRRHLRPNGRLVFDVVAPDLRALLQDPDRAYRGRDLVHPHDRTRRNYYEASHYDPQSQVRSVTMLLSGKDSSTNELAIPLTQRQFFPAELEALLHYNGFAVEAHYGDFERGPLTLASESQVVIARPRSSS